MDNIRNFTIIAHIDHGKSTLSDRLLEVTGTIEARKMRDQVLDQMELERERGITIKMTPVRMVWHSKFKIENSKLKIADSEYILNLIDTPGHIDFSYEVSRALRAVEGAVLLVDATQGVEAQTLSVLEMARKEKLVIIPVVTKIDSSLARVAETKEEIQKILKCRGEDILTVSGKTGEGVENLLNEIVKKIPPPPKGQTFGNQRSDLEGLQTLVFGFEYSEHRGVIVFVRVMSGEVAKGDKLKFKVADKRFKALEVGVFSPEEKPVGKLSGGEIGYIVTGIKEAGVASVGDTLAKENDFSAPLSGYEKPKPFVWASVYPQDQNDFTALRQALGKLKLSDTSFTFEEETSGALGKGFKCGFLGLLHLEIIIERLRREFDIDLVVTTPSITYEVVYKNAKKEKIHSPSKFPDDAEIKEVFEPWIETVIIAPISLTGDILNLLYEHEASVNKTENFGDGKSEFISEMPLRELMRNFFDKLKSVSSGFASISYEIKDLRPAEVTRLDVLVADEVVPAFSKVVSTRRIQEEAESAVEKLSKLLPRQMFAMKVQARGLGRIISSRAISAFRKDVTGHLYGGDITRKMKLRTKQKKGKKKMKERGKVRIPQKVFVEMIKS